VAIKRGVFEVAIKFLYTFYQHVSSSGNELPAPLSGFTHYGSSVLLTLASAPRKQKSWIPSVEICERGSFYIPLTVDNNSNDGRQQSSTYERSNGNSSYSAYTE